VDDDCGEERSCGSCADPADSCVANSCEAAGAVFTCNVTEAGWVSCMDMLESDGWTLADAQAWCEVQSPEDPTTVATATDELGSCKNTVDTHKYQKRCNACEYDETASVPRPCIGRDFYFYQIYNMPIAVCSDEKAGSTLYNPWPNYPGTACTDVRTDVEICGVAECGTVDDICGLARNCDSCDSPDVCTRNTCHDPAAVCTFPDPVLDGVVRNYINQPTGDILHGDLLNIEDFRASDQNIADLTGMECLEYVRVLYLDGNTISDVSPLGGLIRLESLYLQQNIIGEISALNGFGLANLIRLRIHENLITDISGLSGMTSLEYLRMWDNQITDISPLSACTGLRFVGADDNQIGDISALSGKPTLYQLYLRNNQVSDISPLSGLPLCCDSDLSGNNLDCDDPVTQAVIAEHGDDLVTDCPNCVPSSDVCADNGYECGPAYHSDCPSMPVNCGTCADPTDACVANLCEPIVTGGAVYRCDSVQYGAEQCLDFLELDGWTLAEAEAECANFADDPSLTTIMVTTETGSCKNTLDQAVFTKRCDTCEVDFSDTTTPRPCVGNDFYLYVPSYFPDNVCVDQLGGDIVPAPWPDYPLCPDSRTDAEVCGTAECGTVDDGCGVARDCGSCTDPADSCLVNMCEPASGGGVVYRCDGIAYGADHCIDFLASDGWTAVTAVAECAAQSDPGSDTLTTTTLAASCMATVNQGTFPKRCDACEVDTNDPTPRPCVGNDFYLYVLASFPDSVCVDYLGGTIVWAPWPVYDPGCEDTRTDGEVCGGAECGTVGDNCGVVRACGTCAGTDICRSNLCESGSGIVCDFPDPTLEAVIRTQIGQPTGDIVFDDLQGITMLEIYDQGIWDITGLECLTNVVYLTLKGHNISDISPLGGLTNLDNLSLWMNNVSDLSPLANLTNLTRLKLSDNDISDISPLAGLANLTHLYLDGNSGISDYSPVSGLVNLIMLYVIDNAISDISPLASLVNLSTLGCWRNQISDIGPLSGLVNLTTLQIQENQLADISVLSGLTNLTRIEASHNQISDISPLSGLTNLVGLDLDDNQISDISALSGMTSMWALDVSSNQISDISAVAGMTELSYLDIGYNQVSDIGSLSGKIWLAALNAPSNQISDISVISELDWLWDLDLEGNLISDISPIVDCAGIAISTGDVIIWDNLLDCLDPTTQSNIATLEAWDVNLYHDCP
jgi:internalin A